MNRSADAVIAAIKFALANGGVSALTFGDNELARLVVRYEELCQAAIAKAEAPRAEAQTEREELARKCEQAALTGNWSGISGTALATLLRTAVPGVSGLPSEEVLAAIIFNNVFMRAPNMPVAETKTARSLLAAEAVIKHLQERGRE